MAYRDDIIALGASHLYPFDGNDATDVIAAQNATLVGTASGAVVSEDASNSIVTNGTGDSVDFPSIAAINSNTSERKAVAGWFRVNGVQLPPKALCVDGGVTAGFKLVFGFGNNLMFEAANDGATSPFIVQVFGPVLQPNRDYHICAVFESDAFGNECRLYVDGVKQTLANPVGAAPGDELGLARGAATLGSPATGGEIGGQPLTQNAPVNGFYNHWAFWGDNANAQLTDTEVRETLFERGVRPSLTISADTQANMQLALDAIASTTLPDEALSIRIEQPTDVTDPTFVLDNVTFDPLTSAHVQFTGNGDCTVRNSNGSNASIGSSTGTGSLTIVDDVTISVLALDASTGSPIQGARVLLQEVIGGIFIGDTIISGLTDASGFISAQFPRAGLLLVQGRVRKGTTSPLYKTSDLSGTVPAEGLSLVAFMVPDE